MYMYYIVHHKYLTGFYCLRKYYPFPDKTVVIYRLACDAKEVVDVPPCQCHSTFFVNSSAPVTGTVESVSILIVLNHSHAFPFLNAKDVMSTGYLQDTSHTLSIP